MSICRYFSRRLLGRLLATAAVICLGVTDRASAALVTYGFTRVAPNNATNAATGEAQLTVDVTDVGVGPNQVAFIFRNAGPLDSSITDIYFDDGSLLGMVLPITDSGIGVDFSQGANPGNLPGGNTIDFQPSTNLFTADSNPPAQPNGVNPGEFVRVVFDLIAGQDFADVIAALTLGLANPGVDVTGGLRIGIHVQGFANNGSEAFVNGGPTPGPTPVPEPSTVLMGLMGLGALGFVQLRRRRRTVAA